MPYASGNSYDKNFQQQLLAHLRWEEELLRNAVRVLSVDDFEIPVMRIVYEALSRFYLRYHKIPMEPELDDELVKIIHNVDGTAKTGINPEEYEALTSLRGYIGVMYDHRYRNLERFQSELGPYIEWVRSTRVIGSLTPSILRGASPSSLLGKLSDITLEVSSKLDAESSQSFYSQNTGIMMDYSQAELRISTGVNGIDNKLDGGLGLGELGMITACPGMGKTNALINFAAAANFAGQHTLFITLELPETLIKRRYTAIAGCIRGSVVKKVYTEWPEDAKKRLQILQSDQFAAHDYFTVSNKAGKTVTVDMISAEIVTWRERVRRRWGDEEMKKCTSVLVDWADLLHLPNEGANLSEHLRMRKVMEELKATSVRKLAAMWTATQGTREADGKQVVHMRHTSYGYHKNDPIDYGIGLGLADDDQQRQQQNDNMGAQGVYRDIANSGRTLIMNFNKNRNGQTGPVRVYQAPTLRFYDTVDTFNYHDARLLKAANELEAWEAVPRTNLK
jgi:replicative DNA helicase